MERAIAFANRWCLTLVLISCFFAAAQAQKNEFAVSASGLLTSASFSTGSSAGFQINYARRLIPLALINLYLELPFEAGFNGSRTSGPSLNREDYNTLYFTPGLKVKFAPGFPVSPYLAGGLGWRRFRSTNTTASANNFPSDLLTRL